MYAVVRIFAGDNIRLDRDGNDFATMNAFKFTDEMKIISFCDDLFISTGFCANNEKRRPLIRTEIISAEAIDDYYFKDVFELHEPQVLNFQADAELTNHSLYTQRSE